MKFIDESAFKYLSVKAPMIGAFILGVIPAILQNGMDLQLIPPQYHALILTVVLPLLAAWGKKVYQPELHVQNQALGFVTVTAGHSNTDPGAVNGKYREAVLVTSFRNAVAYYLREADLQVKTDGVGTVNQPLSQALSLIHGSQIAVEFHMNATTNKAANGIETIALPKDKILAQELSEAVAQVFGSRLRGDKGWIDQSKSARGSLAFINAGGLIVELGFISNDAELQVFLDRYWLAARAVANVLIKRVK